MIKTDTPEMVRKTMSRRILIAQLLLRRSGALLVSTCVSIGVIALGQLKDAIALWVGTKKG